jgi:hypothetical protein
MALDGKTLGDAIAGVITAADAPEDVKNQIKLLWEAIGGIIVSHIQTNAQVTVAAGIPVSTSGSPAAQTGATTSTGMGAIA